MSLNIKNPETHQLATELATLQGKSLTDAVTQAVREALEREKRTQKKEGLVEDLLSIGRRCAPMIDSQVTSTTHGDLLYDETGMP